MAYNPGDNQGTIYVQDVTDNANPVVLFVAPNTPEVIHSLKFLPSNYEVWYHDTIDYQLSSTTNDVEVIPNIGFDYKLSVDNASSVPNIGEEEITSKVVMKSFNDGITPNTTSSSSSDFPLRRQAFISLNYVGISGNSTSLTINDINNSDFKHGDIVIIKPASGVDQQIIIEDYNISGGKISLSTDRYYLKGGPSGSAPADPSRFIMLQKIPNVANDYEWVEISREFNSQSLLPDEVPDAGEKFYLSKDSSGAIAFEPIVQGNMAHHVGVLDFKNPVVSRDIVAMNLPPCIVVGGHIMVKAVETLDGADFGGQLKIGSTNVLTISDPVPSLLNNDSYTRLNYQNPIELPIGGEVKFTPTVVTTGGGVTEIRVMYIPL